MTAYCTVADVEGAMGARKLVFSGSTAPTKTQVEGYCEQIYDEINQTILRAGYIQPITANEYLTMTNAMGAAWLVEMALNVSGTAESMNVVNMREKAYTARLASIKSNPRLIGAVPAEGTQDNYVMSDKTSNWTNPDCEFNTTGRQW